MNARLSPRPDSAAAGVSADQLSIHFATKAGTVKAVDGVSFAIRAGEPFGLIR